MERSRFVAAVQRLQVAFRSATGVETRVFEGGSEPAGGSNALYQGETAAARAAGVDFSLDPLSRCRVRIVEDRAYVLPKASSGLDLGVDEFVRWYLTEKDPVLILPCADFDVKPKPAT